MRKSIYTRAAAALTAGILALSPLTGCVSTPASLGSTAAESGSASSDGVEAAIDMSWAEDIPRASWSKFEQIDISDDWYDVYKMPGNVYAIAESSQWEEDIMYLVVGQNRAALIDTGNGIHDIKAVVDELTDLPVTVLLSHTHHDHMGGMSLFDDVMVYNSDYAKKRATTGMDEFGDITYEIAPGTTSKELPKGFDADGYHVDGKTPTGTFTDGQLIDLGGRTLEVAYAPGHTADSCCFIDRDNGIVFTGDVYYPADLYAFSEDADLGTYTESMKTLAERTAGLSWIYPGHNEVVEGTSILASVAQDMESILDGTKTDYTIGDEDGYRYYTFDDGAVIVTKDE